MATARKHAQRPRGRRVRRRRSSRTLLLAGLALLLPVGLVAALLLSQAPAGSSLRPVSISTSPAPTGAEVNGRAWGPKDAPILIEEFLDYQCPACQSYALQIEPQVVAAFAATGQVRYEVHNFPFKGEDSRNAAEGAACAAEQNSFWPFHASLYQSLPEIHQAGIFGDERLGEIAGKLGLDRDSFEQCLESERYAGQVEADYREALRRQISSTPTFVINGRPYPGVQTVENLRRIIGELAPGVLPP